MTYEETLLYLYSQMPEYQRVGHSAYKPGLENSRRLDEIFANPHQHYKTIHVGGTNGKGSTSHLLAAILQLSGYKVGLFTSPHLLDFRERIRINGEMISKEYVVSFVEKYRTQFEPVMPSFFELTMEMAFLYFAEQNVDVAVIEVGLGGRLDCTNIITPNMCVITNIGFDHMQYLGNSLTEIAAEKAGIIKSGIPVVIGEVENSDVEQIFIEKAKSMNAPLVFAERLLQDFNATLTDSKWIFNCDEYSRIISGLNGFAQEKNARTVLATIKMLKKNGYNITDDAVYKGFPQVVELTGLMGRWQVLQQKPRIICDTGHNAHGIRYIVKQLKQEQYVTLHIVFGMVNDKDISTILQMLPKNARYYFTKAAIERAIDEKELISQAQQFGLMGESYKDVAAAIDAAKEWANENDLIFIGGSSFIVAEALLYFVGLPD